MVTRATSTTVHALIGGYTAEMDGSAVGIDSLTVTLDDDGGGRTSEVMSTPVSSPSYLLRHPSEPWLFAVSETEPGALSSYRLEEGGTLASLGTVTMTADGPCHLAMAPDGEHLVVANYGSGSVSSFAVRPDGSLSTTLDLWQFTGSVPVTDRQDASHAHQVVWDRDELLVPDLGSDRIHRLTLTASGVFAVSAPPLQLPDGTGPRHLLLLDDHLVVACELSAQLWLARRTASGWESVQTIAASTAPVDVPIYPSAIVGSGSRVFVANRGAGTVGVFDLDPGASRLAPVAEFGCGGEWPRDLALTPGRLWVANQTNDVVTVFSTEVMAPLEPVFAFASAAPACLVLSETLGDRPAPSSPPLEPSPSAIA